MKNIPIVVILLMVISGCDLLSDSYSELSTSVEIHSGTVERLSDIEATFEILNNTGETVSFGFPSSCQFGYTLSKDEEIIMDSREEQACLAVVTSLDIQNGNKKVFQLTIPFDNELEPGFYKLSAFLLEGYTAPVSETFTVDQN